MALYYDSRIQESVVKGWAKDHVESLESRVEVNVPESEIDPCNSFLMKDSKIPIAYKNTIAQRLYKAESEVIKIRVRSQRESWHNNEENICTDDNNERQNLVCKYQKYVYNLLWCYPHSDMLLSRNVPSLSHNVGVVLRNLERECASKGIVWLASPLPSKGGQPVGYLWVFLDSLFLADSHSIHFLSKCSGSTPEGQDFETFIGAEKAQEFRTLFSSWIHKIYHTIHFHWIPFDLHLTFPTAPSDWSLYAFKNSTPNNFSTDSTLEQIDEEEVDVDVNTQQSNPVVAASTSTMPSATSTTPSQPVVTHPPMLPETNSVSNNLPSSDPPPPSDPHPTSPSDPRPSPPSKVSTRTPSADQDQDIQDLEPPSHPDLCVSPRNDCLATVNNLPANTMESGWMKLKKTLKYFCEVHKIGKLSDLILHWYQLEEALSFQETIRFHVI